MFISNTGFLWTLLASILGPIPQKASIEKFPKIEKEEFHTKTHSQPTI